MAGPFDKAAIAAGITVGIGVVLVGLVMLPKWLPGCNSVTTTDSTGTHPDTTVNENPSPVVITDTVHAPIPYSVWNQIDSLRWALGETNAELAAALKENQKKVSRELPWRYDMDTARVVIGRMRVEWCPQNGILMGVVMVDSLITPENITYITKTVFVITGVDFYWLPVAFVLGALAAAGLYAWVVV